MGRDSKSLSYCHSCAVPFDLEPTPIILSAPVGDTVKYQEGGLLNLHLRKRRTARSLIFISDRRQAQLKEPSDSLFPALSDLQP